MSANVQVNIDDVGGKYLQVAIDAVGNIYLAQANGPGVYLVPSTDNGSRWLIGKGKLPLRTALGIDHAGKLLRLCLLAKLLSGV